MENSHVAGRADSASGGRFSMPEPPLDGALTVAGLKMNDKCAPLPPVRLCSNKAGCVAVKHITIGACFGDQQTVP